MCLAIPGQIVTVATDDPEMPTAKVSFGGTMRTVNLAFVPDAAVGEYVLVHVGFALARIDEQEAARILAAFAEIAALEEEADEAPR